MRAGGQTIGYITQHQSKEGAWVAENTRYLLTDHLGSVDTVLNENGNKVQTLGFSAWGKRRKGNWKSTSQSELDSIIASLNAEAVKLNIGFTGHEHDDEVGLINMKGRLYDAEIGRFISADPHIQAPSDTQSFNRYTYVKNNPLSYTDPSGYFFKKLFKGIKSFLRKYARTIFAIAITFMLPGNPMLAGFMSGLVSGGGDLKQAFIGAFSAGVFHGIGQGFGPVEKLSRLGRAAKVIAHGVAGGTMSVLRGGKFREGFVSAGASQLAAVSGLYGKLGASDTPKGTAGYAWNATVSAMIGGTASKLSGGKFSNGAITAAFSRMFNDLGNNAQKRIDRLVSEVRKDHPGLPNPKGLQIIAEAGVGIDGEADTHGTFDSITQIRIAYEGEHRTDPFIKGIIFHELAHLDEALTVAFGVKYLWKAHELFLDGGHDSWTKMAGNQYERWLYVKSTAPEHLKHFNKPNINDAPWRQ